MAAKKPKAHKANKEGKQLCFVIGPIGEPATDVRWHADWLLQGIIRPVFRDYYPEFEIIRADQIRAPGSISSQVITTLSEAALVIADMSMHNANAFYELAIRHVVRLPTVHMIREGDPIPFDVAPDRAIRFRLTTPDDHETAKIELKDAVAAVLADEFVVENPVTRARGMVKAQEHATPTEKLLLQSYQTLQERVDRLEAATRSRPETTSLTGLDLNQVTQVLKATENFRRTSAVPLPHSLAGGSLDYGGMLSGLFPSLGVTPRDAAVPGPTPKSTRDEKAG